MQWLSTNWTDILKYFGVTVEMSILAGLIALVVGTILAAMRVGPVPLAASWAGSTSGWYATRHCSSSC